MFRKKVGDLNLKILHRFTQMKRSDFGEDFSWGVSTAAYQIEGAHNKYGKGNSIWDEFVKRKRKIAKGHHGNHTCDFYHQYESDLDLMKAMHIKNFRFSISWSRIFPEGYGRVNQDGLDFYNKLIDECLQRDITPWITLYHWDLPDALEKQGGWTNRNIVHWFTDYVDMCSRKFGDRVKYWMVLNEPMVFTGAGYFLGVHAPGKKGVKNFLPAAHHAVLCQAQGAQVLRSNLTKAEIGTTFSCSHLEPATNSEKDILACKRMDALLNRMFIEPALGKGYPIDDLKLLNRMEEFCKPGDDKLSLFDFDFIGVQNYTREIVSHAFYIPYLQAKIIKASKRKVPITVMDWEVYPNSIYQMLHKFSAYGIKNIVITENGAAFDDYLMDGIVQDREREEYLKQYIKEVYKAKQEGIPVTGYFVWSFMDNFEWAEGYDPRFGLVYIDFKTQERIIKRSGHWYREFLSGEE